MTQSASVQGTALVTDFPLIAAELPAPVIDLLLSAKFVASKGEARRLIAQSGVRLNDQIVNDVAHFVKTSDLKDGLAKLSLGRKRHVLVRPG